MKRQFSELLIWLIFLLGLHLLFPLYSPLVAKTKELPEHKLQPPEPTFHHVGPGSVSIYFASYHSGPPQLYLEARMPVFERMKIEKPCFIQRPIHWGNLKIQGEHSTLHHQRKTIGGGINAGKYGYEHYHFRSMLRPRLDISGYMNDFSFAQVQQVRGKIYLNYPVAPRKKSLNITGDNQDFQLTSELELTLERDGKYVNITGDVNELKEVGYLLQFTDESGAPLQCFSRSGRRPGFRWKCFQGQPEKLTLYWSEDKLWEGFNFSFKPRITTVTVKNETDLDEKLPQAQNTSNVFSGEPKKFSNQHKTENPRLLGVLAFDRENQRIPLETWWHTRRYRDLRLILKYESEFDSLRFVFLDELTETTPAEQ